MLTLERLAEIDQALCAPSDGYPAGVWCEIANELRAEIDRLRAAGDALADYADNPGRPYPKPVLEWRAVRGGTQQQVRGGGG